MDSGPLAGEDLTRKGKEEETGEEQMASVLVRQAMIKARRGLLKEEWRKEKKKNMDILRKIIMVFVRLEKIGATIGSPAYAHQMIDGKIQDLHRRTTVAGGGQEEVKARGEEWRTLQDQMKEISERTEEEEDAENQAIWERDDLQEEALESARKVRAIRLQMTSLEGGEENIGRDSDSELEPEYWESSGEEEQEGGYPDTDWEDRGTAQKRDGRDRGLKI